MNHIDIIQIERPPGTTAMTAAALAYLVAGFSVVATAMGTKRPLFPWIEFQSRRPTAAEMSAWYRRDPRAGVAIVCEAVSGLAVVSTDSKNSDGTARAVPRPEFCFRRQP